MCNKYFCAWTEAANETHSELLPISLIRLFIYLLGKQTENTLILLHF